MENTQLSKVENQGLSIEKLKGYLDVMGLATKLTDNEKNQFLEISQAFGLNPFKREIYCTVYGEGQYKQFSIITGYEVYIKRAERSGQLNGWNATTTGSVETNDLKATVTIHRKDREHPFVWEAYYDECVQTKKDGTVTSFWKKANFMTKKVAISQAFRLCFSDELGGMPYTSDEMPAPTTEDIPHAIIDPIDEIINDIQVCTSLDGIKVIWDSITKAQRLSKRVLAAKDQMKVKLTPQTAE